ncbi:hypothetical protein [Kribbella sp. CA-247076]|uniref:hypothetical protein n=1 Tax=Kribbella sp. CA-247076 TaxID=3239941 RepID=UPI003D8CCA8A
MNKRLFALTAPVVLVGAGLLGLPAQAADDQVAAKRSAPAADISSAGSSIPSKWLGPTALSQCYSTGVMCFWVKANYTSPNNSILLGQPIPSGQCRKVQPSESYIGSRSFWNRTSITQRVWSSDRCTGQNFLVGTNGKNANAPFLVNSRGGY